MLNRDPKNKQIIHTAQYPFEHLHKQQGLNESNEDEFSIVLSIVYGLLIVILAIVFKVTESITDKVISLFLVSFLKPWAGKVTLKKGKEVKYHWVLG